MEEGARRGDERKQPISNSTLQAKQGSGRVSVSSDVVEKRVLHLRHLEELE